MKLANIEDLKWIRVQDFNLITKYLVEQVKGTSFPVERLYAFGDDIARNPFTLLYVLADEHHRIEGFLWASVNPLDQSIMVNIFSLDRDYWDHGYPVYIATEKIEAIAKSLGAYTR